MQGTRSSMDYVQSNLPKYISFPFLVCKIYIRKITLLVLIYEYKGD
jgi:hypothetical protein